MGTQLPDQDALSRAALAISSAEGAGVFDRLSSELADILRVDVGFIAVFADEARAEMRMLAFCLDGRMRAPSTMRCPARPAPRSSGTSSIACRRARAASSRTATCSA